MSTKDVVIAVDRGEGKIRVEVPEPSEGKWSPQPSTSPEGSSERGTQEQLAHWVFWSNGTSERLDALVSGGASALDTVVWLIKLRILDVKTRTGYTYGLLLDERPSASRQRRLG